MRFEKARSQHTGRTGQRRYERRGSEDGGRLQVLDVSGFWVAFCVCRSAGKGRRRRRRRVYTCRLRL